jgi:hypothetical protein
MAIVPLLALPRVNKSATVYDRNIDILGREPGISPEFLLIVREKQALIGARARS